MVVITMLDRDYKLLKEIEENEELGKRDMIVCKDLPYLAISVKD